jgi:type I restriction enzyme S subunit
MFSAKFVYHFLGWIAKEHVRTGMGNPKLMSDTVATIRIPVLPLTEQERIVAMLDEFDALVNDPSIGLPAELNARRQEYEYYRDRLLTFPEAT